MGRNGAGKSTLLRLLTGDASADSGRVSRTAGTRVGLLGQRDDHDPRDTVRHVVLGDAAPHEWAGRAPARR